MNGGRRGGERAEGGRQRLRRALWWSGRRGWRGTARGSGWWVPRRERADVLAKEKRMCDINGAMRLFAWGADKI